MGQRKVSYTQRILESSYVREENIDIDILVTSRNSDWKVTVYQNNKQTSLKNKEVEPIEPVQMNIYQSSTCVRLRLAIFRQWGKGSREATSEGPTVLDIHFCSLSNNPK